MLKPRSGALPGGALLIALFGGACERKPGPSAVDPQRTDPLAQHLSRKLPGPCMVESGTGHSDRVTSREWYEYDAAGRVRTSKHESSGFGVRLEHAALEYGPDGASVVEERGRPGEPALRRRFTVEGSHAGSPKYGDLCLNFVGERRVCLLDPFEYCFFELGLGGTGSKMLEGGEHFQVCGRKIRVDPLDEATRQSAAPLVYYFERHALIEDMLHSDGTLWRRREHTLDEAEERLHVYEETSSSNPQQRSVAYGSMVPLCELWNRTCVFDEHGNLLSVEQQSQSGTRTSLRTFTYGCWTDSSSPAPAQAMGHPDDTLPGGPTPPSDAPGAGKPL